MNEQHTDVNNIGSSLQEDWIGHANIQNTIIYSGLSHSSSRQEMGKALADWK